MIEVIALRQSIQALLAGLVGTYTHGDGYVEDAIAVLADPTYGYDYPNNGCVTKGIECVVLRPFPKLIPLLGGASMKEYRWAIALKQWDARGNLLEATEALVNGLPYLVGSPVWVPPDANRGIIEQVRLEVIEWDFCPARSIA